MRTLYTAFALGLFLAVAACSKAEQQNTQAEAQAKTDAAAQDVKEGAQKAGTEIKEGAQAAGTEIKEGVKDVGFDVKQVANDEDVKKATAEVKSALKDLGVSVKKAAKETQDEPKASDGAKSTGSNDNG